MQKILIRGPKMKKTAVTALILILAISASLPAQNAANDDYIKAMTTTDPLQILPKEPDYSKHMWRNIQAKQLNTRILSTPPFV
jgi:hypothetical protein